MPITHAKTSAKSDGGDATLILPSDWNAAHTGGSDLVQVASGAGSIIIPGLSGSPDIRVAATNDDEFDQNAAGTPSGWTSFNSPDTLNTNDIKSHVHIKKNANANPQWAGIYKTNPSTPFTMTAKITDSYLRSQWEKAGIFVGQTTPGSASNVLVILGNTYETGVGPRAAADKWTDYNTYGASAGGTAVDRLGMPLYIRIVANSNTSLDFYVSRGGLIWIPIVTAYNPSITIATVGLAVSPENSSNAAEAFFDWVRFT